MPVYKGDKYLPEAVNSILNQTFNDFEFIIICDDPTDETRLFLDQSMQNDSRIKIFYQERQGLVRALNRGVSFATGEYIVRMDADDISLSNRLEKQVKFMDSNPEIGISGTWIKTFGKFPKLSWKLPSDHETIVSKMLFESVIAHPSVIIRKSTFCEKGLSFYQDETYAEDYGLWVRASKVLILANLPEVLLYFRVHESTTNKNISKKVANKIRLSQLSKLGINPTKSELEIHEALSYYKYGMDKKFICSAKSWLEKLQDANLNTKVYPEPAFFDVLASYWYAVCFTPINFSLYSWRKYHSSKLSKSTKFLNIHINTLLLRPTIKHLKTHMKLFGITSPFVSRDPKS